MSLDRIVSFLGIASGDARLFPRRVQFVSPATGWRGFVDKYIRPQRELGISRFLLWMPFGQEDALRDHEIAGRRYPSRLRFDQFQQARRAGLDWLVEGFVDAIRPLADDGCQMIAYCGTLAGAVEYERERWHRDRWIDACLAPFKEANCDLAFDSAVLAPPGSYTERVVERLRSESAARVYVEAMPYRASPGWARGDVISDEVMYQHALNPANEKLFVDPREITGELVRGFWGAPPAPWSDNPARLDWAGWYRARVPAALDDGHTVCLQVRAYVSQGGRIEELVGHAV